VPDPVRKLDRTRREARRFAADARALAARGRRRLSGEAREAVLAACDGVDAAARDGDPGRLSAALRALDALWEEHLGRLVRPPWRDYAAVAAASFAAALLVRALVVEAFVVPSSSMAPTLLPGDRILASRIAYGLRVPLTGIRLGGAPPRRGDVVVFESPGEPGRDLVKRVAGIAGDVVELREQILLVNGVPQPRSAAGEVSYEERGGAGAARAVVTCPRFREALARGRLAPVEGGDPAAAESSWQAAAAEGVANHDVLQCRLPRPGEREGPYGAVAPGHVFVLGDNRDRSSDGRDAGGWQVPLDRVKGRVGLVLWGDGAAGGRAPRVDRLLRRVE
jgi:signal peptidase I